MSYVQSAKKQNKGEVAVLPAFAPTGLFPSLVKEIPFETVKWGSAGRTLPRKVAQFTYDEIHRDLSSVPSLDSVITLFCTQFNVNPHKLAFWFNLYEDGNHYTPYHRDSYGCNVYTLSFGGPRDFLSKDKEGNVKRYTLKDGDLMMFDETWNYAHTHSVPKSKTQNAPRISMVIFIQ
jgi:hypothetical protein